MGEGDVRAERNIAQREADLDLRASALVAREATLAEREAAVTVEEEALVERHQLAHEIINAAAQRDAISDSRDVGGDTREQNLDRANFLATGNTYGDDWPLRRGAALDREHAKGDRNASRDDRVALTEDSDGPKAP